LQVALVFLTGLASRFGQNPQLRMKCR